MAPPAIEKGWAYGTIVPASVQADNNRQREGIIGLTNKDQPPEPDDWGALRAGAGSAVAATIIGSWIFLTNHAFTLRLGGSKSRWERLSDAASMNIGLITRAKARRFDFHCRSLFGELLCVGCCWPSGS